MEILRSQQGYSHIRENIGYIQQNPVAG